MDEEMSDTPTIEGMIFQLQKSETELLKRELADLRAQLAERNAALAGCVLIARNVLLALAPDLPNTIRPTFKEFSEAIDSLPASAKHDAEILRAAKDHIAEWEKALEDAAQSYRSDVLLHIDHCSICQASRAKQEGKE